MFYFCHFTRVNGNVDLIVHGTTLLKLLDSNSNSSNLQHVDHSTLTNIKDLMETFGYFHQKGAGGERYMNNYEDFKHILKTARSIKDAQVGYFCYLLLISSIVTSMLFGYKHKKVINRYLFVLLSLVIFYFIQFA